MPPSEKGRSRPLTPDERRAVARTVRLQAIRRCAKRRERLMREAEEAIALVAAGGADLDDEGDEGEDPTP